MTSRFSKYSTVPYREEEDPKMGHRDPSSAAAMRRVALLVDGMARAAILPFGPRLVHRLAFHNNWFGAASELDTFTWSQIAFPTAIVIMVYTLGRSLGKNIMPRHLPLAHAKLPQHVARLGGVAFALHLYTFGAGLNSVRWLVAIRFLSSLLAGFLCEIANSPLPEDRHVETPAEDIDDELMDEGTQQLNASEEQAGRMRKRSGYVDVTPATAKIYMTGFALSILSGGLLYRHASTSPAVQALTGGYPLTLSPLFFAAVSFTVEFVLRCVFAYSAERSNRTDARQFTSEGGAVQRIVNNVVNRRVRISANTPSRSLDVPYLGDIEEGHMSRDDATVEFFDPLSLSRHPEYQQGHRNTPLRTRLNSARSETSVNEFYDCNSTFSDEVIDLDADPHTTDVARGSSGDNGNAIDTDVALYQNGRCVYRDGSPAFVPLGDCRANVPKNYIDICSGNINKARRMWKATQEWRQEKDVWKIHTQPHPFYAKIKEAYPHAIHGRSKTGQAVVYEQPGKMNLKELFRSGCEISEMVKHYTFLMEYIGSCVGTSEEMRELSGADSASYDSSSWGTMVVLDLKGASVTSLSGDVLSYLKQSGGINSSHYPNSLKRVFVVNAPFWLAGAWSTIKSVLPESVHVEVLSASKAIETLRQYIDEDQIPQEYGGSSPYPFGEHPYQQGLNDLVQRADEYEKDSADVVSRSAELTVDASYSFNHNEQRWVNDQPIIGTEDGREDSEMLNAATWRTELTKTPTRLQNAHPLRRRTSSTDRRKDESSPLTGGSDAVDREDDIVGSSGGEGEILLILSIMYTCWCGVQGAVETAVPLLLLTPAMLGGLGYAPSRSGMAMFSASLVLLWLMRTKVARVMSQVPNKAPMRAFRIGVGSEAVLLALLPLVPCFVTSIARTDSVLIMTSTIMVMSCIALASMLGRSGVAILHRIASESFSRTAGGDDNWFTRIYGKDQLLSDCESGRLTWLLRLSGEILGIVMMAPLYCWSTSQERPAPFDASCVFCVASLVTFVLYVSSFSLHLNVVGEFAPHPRESGCSGDVDTRKCCSFAGEVFAVSVGDMASLFDESNWSSSPLLGYRAAQAKEREVDRSVQRVTKSV